MSDEELAAYAEGFEDAKRQALEACVFSQEHSNQTHRENNDEYLAEINTAEWIAKQIEALKPTETT